MSREILEVQKRDRIGKGSTSLRKGGVLPAVVYGPNVESENIQVDLRVFRQTYKVVGDTDLLDLQVEGEKDVRPVLVYGIQVHPITELPLHVDFFQVDLTEKVEVNVPIEIIGEAPAVANHIGLLLQVVDELPIKVLPTDIPHSIEVDISGLNEIGDSVAISDVKIPEGAEVMIEDQEEIIVKIEEERVMEEELDEEEEVSEGEEGTEKEGEEGAAEDETTEE